MKRQNLFNIHFYLSSFFTPFLLLMAITGTLYLFGEKGSVNEVLVQETVTFDESSSQKEQISELLKKVDPSYSFESINNRGKTLQTRPTTRDYYHFVKQENGTFSVYKMVPNFLSRVIDVHKGHGPVLLKNLQKVLGICLMLIVITGFLMSMKIKKRIKPFLVSIGLGTLILVILFYL